MLKLTAMLMTLLVSLGLASLLPAQPPGDEDAPPPKAKVKAKGKEKDVAKKKGEPGPRGDLTKAYDLLRRLRSDETTAGRPEERIRDWTERATRYYQDGLKAFQDGDEFLAHEYGAIAHDLARAADHARNAALFDRRDPELKPPPAGPGPGDMGERTRRDLHHAYDRIVEIGDRKATASADVYLKAARDLYTAARRDVEAGREERGGELARSAEAMTHVVDHLGHAADGPPEKGKRERGGPRAKAKHEPPPPPDEPEPKRKRGGRPDNELPPELPSR